MFGENFRKKKKEKNKINYTDHSFYMQKKEELCNENRTKQNIEKFQGNPKALSKALNKFNLSDSEFIEFSFKDIVSTRIIFVFCDLSGSDFSNTVLSECDFTFANLEGCDFRDATLTNCIFRHSNLRKANFTRTKMLFCDFTGSNFHLLNKSN